MNKRDGLSAMKERLFNNSDSGEEHSLLSSNQAPPVKPRSSFNNISIDKNPTHLNSISQPPTRPKNSLRSNIQIEKNNIENVILHEKKVLDLPKNPNQELEQNQSEDNYDIQVLKKENSELRKELENLKMVFYKAINLKYENINILDSEGKSLSNDFIVFLETLQNRSFSAEFNHLQAELLEYKYNLKLKEQTEAILKDEIHNLQNFYSEEQLKVRNLENYIQDIEKEIKELSGVHQDIKQIYLEEKAALNQEIKYLKQYHQEVVKSNETVFKSFLDQYHEQLEQKVKEYDSLITSLQIEVKKYKETLEKQKQEFLVKLQNKEREITYLKYRLGEPLNYSSFNQYDITHSNLLSLDNFRHMMSEYFSELDNSIYSLYTPVPRHETKSPLEKEVNDLSKKIDSVLKLYDLKASMNFLESKSIDDYKNNRPEKFLLKNNLFSEFEKFRNNMSLEKSNKQIDVAKKKSRSIDELFKDNDISAIEKLKIDSNVKAKALSICTIKKVINERSEEKIKEHESNLNKINLEIENLEQKIKSIKYSIFEIEHDPNLKLTLTPAEHEKKKLELYYELDIRRDEFDDLKEEEQRLKRNHLTYLQERDAQLTRVNEEERRLIAFIKKTNMN